MDTPDKPKPDPMYVALDNEELRNIREYWRKIEHDKRMQAHKLHQEGEHSERLSYIDGVKTFGAAAIKSLFLLNGGAILALLTFTGAFFAKGSQDAVLIGMSLAKDVGVAFFYYVIGLILAAVAMGIGYINYSILSDISREPIDYLLQHYGTPPPVKGVWAYRATTITAWIAVALCVGGLACFAYGSKLVIASMARLGA